MQQTTKKKVSRVGIEPTRSLLHRILAAPLGHSLTTSVFPQETLVSATVARAQAAE